MLFVKTQDLKIGMRLAKPIYNKKGVLLYDRDTKLTKQGISSIRNFELIGIYILESQEPLPPLSEDDIEFERFQTVGVFSLKENLKDILNHNTPRTLDRLVEQIQEKYGNRKNKISFMQNLRSPSDYVYKHSLNVAILCALISNRMIANKMTQNKIIKAALIHDVGKLLLSDDLICMDEYDDQMKMKLKQTSIEGINFLKDAGIESDIINLITDVTKAAYSEEAKLIQENQTIMQQSIANRILFVAGNYDKLTAMKMDVLPMSEIAVIRMMFCDEQYDKDIVLALIKSINILIPGVCVELTNGEKGLVISENKNNILMPSVLSFSTNQIYNIEKMKDSLQIKDIMKTMDNRIIIDRELLKEYGS